MKQLLTLIRPGQWAKNVFVFIPLFFGGGLLDGALLCRAAVAFVAFSLVASAVYCLNDVIDVEADRRHSVKRHRPVASGAVSVRSAYLLMGALLLLSLLAAWLLGGAMRWSLVAVIAVYFVLNVAYCLWLKHYAIVDVCIIAFGFVLRLLAGGMATGVVLSKWIVLMTFLITLFLSFSKRRDDVLRMNSTGEAPRKNTVRYNLTFVNQAITITASVTLVCYIMYTVSPEVAARTHSEYLYLTSVFVLLGLLRFIQVAVVDEKSGDPTKVMLHDRFMQAVVVLWALSFLLIIYVFNPSGT